MTKEEFRELEVGMKVRVIANRLDPTDVNNTIGHIGEVTHIYSGGIPLVEIEPRASYCGIFFIDELELVYGSDNKPLPLPG